MINLLVELFKHTESSSETAPKILYIAISSDGGLCGGIHSSISRQLKKDIAKEPGHIAVVGDKPKAQLSRSMASDFTISFNSVGKDVPTFAEASAIADGIIKSGGDWDEVGLPFGSIRMAADVDLLQVRIVSNHYLSAISYEAQTVKVISAQSLKEAG